MKPGVERVLAGVAARLRDDAVPGSRRRFRRPAARARALPLLQGAIEEFDRAAARRVDEIRALRVVRGRRAGGRRRTARALARRRRARAAAAGGRAARVRARAHARAAARAADRVARVERPARRRTPRGSTRPCGRRCAKRPRAGACSIDRF